ncbi:MAG: phosphoribosylformimino-5-aminoimidazole carboxamide ribotide isomerase [Lachnospiraceae bacterium]|nr:phosphoribosylformimino-5-aminoimidazole carboxamide ribotide isomerase [Lachnospiraceae bacterium]
MEFRPCIDIHNGKVKQIVGSSLKDEGNAAKENFVASHPASYFAEIYRSHDLKGGHVILLNSKDSEYYNATKEEALSALRAFPGGLQVGGGIDDRSAAEFIDAGASQVIVTSYVFKDGELKYDKLRAMQEAVGKNGLVLDLSCRRKAGTDDYFLVTDRWQKFTNIKINKEFLEEMAGECAELLIHAVDVEGKSSGIDENIVSMLSEIDDFPVTYAGGVRNLKDIEKIRFLGKNKVNYTVGSALKLFGGNLEIEDIIDMTI